MVYREYGSPDALKFEEVESVHSKPYLVLKEIRKWIQTKRPQEL